MPDEDPLKLLDVLSEGDEERNPLVPRDDQKFTLNEFCGFWRQGKWKVDGSRGLVSVPYNKALEKVLRKCVPMFQHFRYKHVPEIKEAIDRFHRYEPRLTLEVWRHFFFFAKVMSTPGADRDPIMVSTAAQSLKRVRDATSSSIVIPTGIG